MISGHCPAPLKGTLMAIKIRHENALVTAFKAGQFGNLKNLPHPIPSLAGEKTAFDYVTWCIQYGRMGQTAVKLLEQALPEVK